MRDIEFMTFIQIDKIFKAGQFISIRSSFKTKRFVVWQLVKVAINCPQLKFRNV